MAARQLLADLVAYYNAKRLHGSASSPCPALDKLEGRAETIWAECDRKLAAAREARRVRRAEARLNGSASEGLTSAKETPMIHPAGETDAGTLSLSRGGE